MLTTSLSSARTHYTYILTVFFYKTLHRLRRLFLSSQIPPTYHHPPPSSSPSSSPPPKMPAFPPAPPSPRVVIYHQTHYDGPRYISLQPLLDSPDIFITHLILAALHLNETPGSITLNDRPPSDPLFAPLWDETAMLKALGTKVLAMLGGAAPGTYARLSGSDQDFENFYKPLAAIIRKYRFDGLDLDVEEPTTLSAITRLIDRLRADFGPSFIITLAPVAPALIDPRANLSGFSYAQLEQSRGHEISWYNTQFYCGWGSLESPTQYAQIIQRGWKPERIVAGTVTNGENGNGYVEIDLLAAVLMQLQEVYPTFGGVMGWEYFNSLPGGREVPHEWAQWMTSLLGAGEQELREQAMVEASDRDLEWDRKEEELRAQSGAGSGAGAEVA